MLSDAMAANEDHGLQQQIGIAGFALNVIDGIAHFDICIKAEDHSGTLVTDIDMNIFR